MGETLRKPQIISSASGEELVVLAHSDYEDLVDHQVTIRRSLIVLRIVTRTLSIP
jgi:hypothetical protein